MLVEMLCSDAMIKDVPAENVALICKNIGLIEKNISVSGLLFDNASMFYAYLKTEKTFMNLVVLQNEKIETSALYLQHDFVYENQIKHGEIGRLVPVLNMEIKFSPVKKENYGKWDALFF